jgi:phosphoglycolate phosphatase
MPGRLILWDIDGTLVRVGQIGADIFSRAIEHALGRHPGDHGIAMGGKTDPQIALEILAGMGVEAGEGRHHLPLILGQMEAELAGAVDLIRERGQVLGGVREILPALHDHAEIVQTVLTGNTTINAATKLAAFDLDRWLDLDIGAYGSDSADRKALVPVALQRAHERRGHTFHTDDVWVVGDTPHDLTCAKAGGAHCVLVATGSTPIGTLEGIGADAVLADLRNVDEVLALLCP